MTFKINIGEKSGKTYKLELEGEALVGKELHNKIDGKLISPDLEGYEFEITGTSDKAGFTSMKEVEGIGLKKIFLKDYGKGLKKRPKKEGKKKRSDTTPKGLRLRKTVRGKIISKDIVQVNLKILKEGTKKLSEVFPDQGNKEVKLNRVERRKPLRIGIARKEEVSTPKSDLAYASPKKGEEEKGQKAAEPKIEEAPVEESKEEVPQETETPVEMKLNMKNL